MAMSNPVPPSGEQDLAAFDALAGRVAALRQQIGRVIVGQERIVEPLLLALLCQGHVLVVGVPGLAKTLLVRTLASALHLTFRRIQFTPDLMPSDIVGTELIQDVANSGGEGGRQLRFVPGPIFAQLILADEINRTPPKTQAALLEAMAERQVTVGGQTYRLQEPFVVVATQNPIEQEGTYPLPEAQLDRFMFSLWMDYPGREDEVRIVAQTAAIHATRIEPMFDASQVLQLGRLIEQMPASEHVVRYAVDLSRATRPNDARATELSRKYVAWGAGPRAGQYLLLGAKALAAMQGQPAPSCQHVRQVAPAVLRHRIVVNYQATGEGVSATAIIDDLLQRVPESAT
jgi:MoxR-like ATPase